MIIIVNPNPIRGSEPVTNISVESQPPTASNAAASDHDADSDLCASRYAAGKIGTTEKIEDQIL
tara:strand:- start:329 stop:520 length:192 start_codon:yes stop_codon:yes gene_type:complete